ncbi:hypothetical protein EIP91_010937 [Steccherinum ochraceum]|uniref:CxC5 like cysteine cluster associated with KDZ domain-containing protein n=1 Tax=Steccherinum ochraceum TaxID=92696 RepID=A0A4R0R035_9APHY|nr:hypothetical protein EIP91_010937 [Steccherinum ochraceum]
MSSLESFIYALTAETPQALKLLSVPTLVLWVRLLTHLRDHLTYTEVCTADGVPMAITNENLFFFAEALKITRVIVRETWAIHGRLLWKYASTAGPRAAPFDLLQIFLKVGVQNGIGFRSFFPPVKHCITEACQQRELVERRRIYAVLFTRELGPVPAVSYSSSCAQCHATFYPAYWVHGSGEIRTHYLGIPSAIQVAAHAYIETSLCDRITDSMVCAWVSSTNNARIYNLEHAAQREGFPSEDIWKATVPELTTALVWDSFFIYALLRHFDELKTHLVLSNRTLLVLDGRIGTIYARSAVIPEMDKTDRDHGSAALSWMALQLGDRAVHGMIARDPYQANVLAIAWITNI